MPRQQRPLSLPLMLLAFELFGIGLDKIPPVTLGTIFLQVLVFQRIFNLPWKSPWDICIGAHTSLTDKKGILNLFYSAFEHGHDWHLYYNMVSFLMKGLYLERKLGSKRFFYVLTVFTALTGLTYVWLSRIAGEFLDGHFGEQCAVGFSGVIFALKVLSTHYWPRQSYVIGYVLTVPASWVVWVELLLIQAMVPNVSFLGHLAGILVGVAYVKGPLKLIMDSVWSVVSTLFGFESTHEERHTSGTAPRQREPTAGFRSSGYHHGPASSAYVPPGMTEEEQFNAAIHASLSENYPPFHNGAFNSHRAPYPTTDFGPHPSNTPPPPGFRLYPDLGNPSSRTDHFMS